MVNYKKLNTKIGLEIHQQIDSGKLFCRCPSILLDKKPDLVFRRKLRASAGESGTVDIAAEYETLKNKTFIYHANKENSCLFEYDEEPCHEINKDALKIALETSLLLNAKIIDEIQVMRKVVVDGSNTSGFQRTALVAVDGFVNTSKGNVGIMSVSLEEDSARKIKQDKNSVTYNLDRLGIPLIEIATNADIKDDEHAKETASVIGMILRSTGKIKRGLGTIRQDVNLSILGKSRIEIKGFQDLKKMPNIIENEVNRLLTLKSYKSEVRKTNEDFTTSFLRPMPGSSRLYPETDVKPVRITKTILDKIKLPELIIEKTIRLEEDYTINADLAREIVKLNIDIENYINKFKNIEPELIAKILIEVPKEIKSRFKLDIKKIKEQNFNEVLERLNNNTIGKDAIIEILTEIAKGHKINYSKYKVLATDNIEEDIKNIVRKNKGVSFNAIMGEVMKKYRGKVDSKKVVGIIKKLI